MLEKLPESLGHALVNQRAGMENVLYNQLFRLRQTARLQVRSSAFVFNARLPPRFTADGEGISPPLAWDDVPDGTASIALIVEDADSPTPHPLVHAIVVGLGGVGGSMEEGALNSPNHLGIGLEMGQNSFFKQAWLPPDPPRGHGEHRYVFQVFALGAGQPFSSTPGRREFIDVVLEHAIGVGCLIGTYERAQRVGIQIKEQGGRRWTAEARGVSALDGGMPRLKASGSPQVASGGVPSARR
jgi:Raf kinase inhibitor-like YbhB/YbcL family protein